MEPILRHIEDASSFSGVNQDMKLLGRLLLSGSGYFVDPFSLLLEQVDGHFCLDRDVAVAKKGQHLEQHRPGFQTRLRGLFGPQHTRVFCPIVQHFP